jgi:ribonucleoside-diphosphate reductase alpha chain
MSAFARSIYLHKYALRDNAGNLLETEWGQTAIRVATHVLGALGYAPDSDAVRETAEVIANREFLPGGRYLYASGKEFHQTNNCALIRAEDSREGWADLLAKCALALQTGAGIGVEYSDVRARGSRIRRTGGVASGPVELMRMINEVGRGIRQGGDRRSAIWAGLVWSHPDVPEFLAAKDWPEHIKAQKAKDFNAYAPLDMTNVSVGLDDDFFAAMADQAHPQHEQARRVYAATVAAMFRHGEPGFAINLGSKRRESLRNACTEVVSEDDSDVCNLGSINLARVESVERLREVVRIATRFLLAGTVYSDTPYDRVAVVRAKNRRLGLGVMGLHEWLLARGKRYQPDAALGEWLAVYRDDSRTWADHWADLHSLSRPVAVRAIAPTGTIGILAETTTGIEPIFCAAYKRRYLGPNNVWQYQYVVDPTAKRLVDAGVDPDAIEDATTLALDMERRLAFQAWVQEYVDMAISSTINLPPWGSAGNNADLLPIYGEILLRYLPRLRGITVYPDGARGGQPLTPVAYREAAGKEGVVYEETEERCVGGVCGV